ncbi:ATP-binding protein [Clostridium sp. Marseille-P2415]|uniref:ATP-binding protein n=1 Tax=Clostridium sp. Marseille-P2415 TaxID=1805471 RepID=UPI001F2C269C|nr:ATP-binding protein [Clostridium sp. Marseille-P2415]
MDNEIEIPKKLLFAIADSDGYERIINNLIPNVIIHSQAAQIKIEMGKNDSEIKIRIEDNRIGIEKILVFRQGFSFMQIARLMQRQHSRLISTRKGGS